MSQISISTGDVNCRYLAAPESQNRSQFGRHLESLGIKLPPNLSIRTMVERGWLRPRLRVGLSVPALLSWSNFPSYPADLDGTCPAEDEWALSVWCSATHPGRDESRTVEKLWMHWLDDPHDDVGVRARANAIDPTDDDAETLTFVHPSGGRTVRPWVDFFADWQAYHVAELVRRANFSVRGVTTSTRAVATHAQRHASTFCEDAKRLSHSWDERGHFLDYVTSYRTILAHVVRRDSFDEDARSGAGSWAVQAKVDSGVVRSGIRDVLLKLWRRWEDASPPYPDLLRRRLRQDIQYSTWLLRDLAGESVDPFDAIWYSRTRSRRVHSDLIDALPFEEWVARRDFCESARLYQRGFPARFALSREGLTRILTTHWSSSAPLRRFCLAWVRFHGELNSRLANVPVDATIKANERIEQFNLIGLHVERLLRSVHCRLGEQADPNLKGVVQKALARAVGVVERRAQNIAGKRFSELWRRTNLEDRRPADQLAIDVDEVRAGDAAVDLVVAAHLNAVIARNYAAHHDYLDWELSYPSGDEQERPVGGSLLSSCLLVVVATLHLTPSEHSEEG